MENKTKNNILEAAKTLFTENSYDDVGIRKIAQKAGCSHTTIYLYFKSKDGILYTLSEKPLKQLFDKLLALYQEITDEQERLLEICHAIIAFGFEQGNFYDLLIFQNAERIDNKTFQYPINELRIECIKVLQSAIATFLPSGLSDEESLNIGRGLFIFLHGFVSLYAGEGKSYDNRLRQIVSDYVGYSIIKTI